MTKVFTVPTCLDPEQSQAAQWLNAFLVMAFFIGAGAFFFYLPVSWIGETYNGISLFVIGGLLANILASWLLIRSGQYQIAAFVTIITLFLIPTYLNVVVYQTIHSPDVWVYFILIPLAGLLLGRRYMLYFTLICLCTVLILFSLETLNWITPAISLPAEQNDLLVLSVSLSLNALLLYTLIRRAEDKTVEARQSLEEFMVTNQQLKESQIALQQARSQLELRVAERTQALQAANQLLQEEIVTRQQLMDALHHSEANWRSLVQHAPELIATIATDGTISFVNRNVRGIPAKAMCGCPIDSLHSSVEHQQKLQNALANVLAQGQSVSYESEEEHGGQHTWAINRLGPIYQNGIIAALILISTDITEQKQTEMAMLHSQKLESLGIMAGGVAHDFNNLLVVITGQASLALNKAATNVVATQEHVQNILLAGRRATDLTRQMLNYAGRSSIDFKSLDLDCLIQENIQFFSASIPKSIQLQALQTPELPAMRGDAGQIQQLIMNLILNAADAIGEEAGTIRVTTAEYYLPPSEVSQWKWSGELLKSGLYVLLDVADTGCGMDSETLNKIFDPFFTTKFSGRGLGLASVVGIVRSHGGGLQVVSTPGAGTTFRMLFPVSEQREKDEVVEMKIDETVLFANKLILVIDDEDDVRQVTAEILELSDIEVLQAANGMKGIELFRQHINEIDLILLDLSMPGMSGEEVLRQLWQLKPNVAVTLLSGYDQHEVTRRMGNDHTLSFLQKPYSMDGLLHEVGHQFAKMQKSAQPAQSDLVLAG